MLGTSPSKAPLYSTVAQWAKCFREEREDINDDPRSARPLSEPTDENIELRREVISNVIHIQLMTILYVRHFFRMV